MRVGAGRGGAGRAACPAAPPAIHIQLFNCSTVRRVLGESRHLIQKNPSYSLQSILPSHCMFIASWACPLGLHPRDARSRRSARGALGAHTRAFLASSHTRRLTPRAGARLASARARRCLARCTRATMITCGNASGALYIAHHSHCPGEQWHEEIAHLPHGRHGEELHFVNIGANKGYNLVAFYQRYARAMQAQPLSFRRWHDLLRRNSSGDACKAQCCGVCGDCRGAERRGPRDARRLRMHALEAAPVNAAILRRVVQQSELAGLVTVHATGASDSVDAPLYARFDTRPGYEGDAVSLASRGSRIATTTADLFFEAERIPHAHMVTVDTEGWDGRVLAGMRATLAAKRHAAAARTRPAHGHALPAGHPPAAAWRLLQRRRASRRARLLLSRVPGWTYSSSSTRCTGGDTGAPSRCRPRCSSCCAPGTAASGRGGTSTACSRPRPALAGRRGSRRSTRRPGETSSAATERTCSPCSKGGRLGRRGGHLGESEPF